MIEPRPPISEVLPGRLYVAAGTLTADLSALGFGCLVVLDDEGPTIASGCEIRWRGNVLDGPVAALADVAYAHLLEGRRVLVWSAPDGRVPAAWVAVLMAARWLHCGTADALAVVRAATGGDPADGEWDDLARGFDR